VKRRAKTRTRVLMTATVITPAGSHKVLVRDISREGAQIYADKSISAGNDACLRRGPIFVAARIAWCRNGIAGLQFYRELTTGARCCVSLGRPRRRRWRMSTEAHKVPAPDRRESPRLNLRCRARIRVGKREYAGYVEDISNGGARIRTLTPIQGIGPVCLIIPDLPPIRGYIRWMEPQSGGVCFSMSVSGSVLAEWARSRMANANLQPEEAGSADQRASA
jgi:hypothetical protein